VTLAAEAPKNATPIIFPTRGARYVLPAQEREDFTRSVEALYDYC
jgi:hypothetical protein